MIPVERQRRIRQAIEAKGMVSIAELVEMLDVSHMTVRRDLQLLEQEGHLNLVSGGAQKVSRFFTELPINEKRELQYPEKLAIAREAVKMVRPGTAIYFDAGSTCLAVAEEIVRRPALRDSIIAVTNDFSVANHFMLNSRCRLYHTGGEVLRDNKSCIGELTASLISGLNIDLAFLSSSSWNETWMSTPNEAKIAVKIAAVKASERAVLVTDTSKFGKVGFFNVIKLQDLDAVITDNALAPEKQDHLLQTGVNLKLVEPLSDDTEFETLSLG
ncbi:DeoR/GlpR family DNA-binding transcription regulator [Cohaesibacter haloalkalitolerans]|uniref:DeoR/GlpR family DNA-binding transcription regulator n=1 Tax=Cohaesibacter haloalkalitolerans TaxID=1162980 RepID=UPI000E6525EE|nr:DeoR/GlpR family DNA-binding transcription regulator [Cohaesibacter haloalkalitolerans]